MANRYSQYIPGVNYSPESFRDMSIVPIALRQRHDAALAAQDDMLLQLDNIQVRDEDRDYLNQKREEITGQINSLTDKINTIGAGDANLMSEFRNMKRAYNKEVSLAGGLGQASNVKQRIDQTRAQYLDFGVKQGWSPETAQKNFEIEYGRFNEENPSERLGTPGFAFGEFNPTFAPTQINPVDKLKEIQPLIGEISKEEAFQNYRPVIDPNTGMITYQSFGGSKLSRSNLERLQSVEKFLNQELMNPDSELRQSLRYSRPGVPEEQVIQQFLTESDLLIDAMGIEAQKTVTSVEAPVTRAVGGSGGEKSKTSDEPASLVSTPTGQDVFEGKSITDILSGSNIKKYEELERQGTITEEDINNKTLEIFLNQRVSDALKDPSTIRDINTYLKANGELGTDASIETYNNQINSLENQINQLKNTEQYKNSRNILDNGIRYSSGQRQGAQIVIERVDAIQNKVNSIKGDLDEAYNNAIPKDDLKYSRLYTFGAGEAAKKSMDTFNSNATDYGINWVTQIENAGGRFTLPGETELKTNNDTDELKELKESFANGQTKFSFGSLIDMGSTGSSQLVINYTNGEGEKAKTGMLSIDFDNKSTDTSVIENWLVEMQKTLDSPGQAVIQSILDNKQFKNISVDNEEFSKKGFSKYQSDIIKNTSNKVNENYNIHPEYKAINYNNYPGREYNMVLNNDGFYQLFMRDGKNKEAKVLSAGDWLNKQFVKGYIDKTISVANPFKATTLPDKKNFSMMMMDLALISDNNSLVQVDKNSGEFQKIKNDFISEINKNQNNINLQYELAIEFYNSIKNYSIAHKNKKRNL